MASVARQQPRLSALAEAGLGAVGMCVFGLFAHRGFPWALLAAAGLAATVLALHRAIMSVPDLRALLGLGLPSRSSATWLIGGVTLGIGLAAAFRWRCGQSPFPAAFGLFAAVAGLVGAAEELLYRGYIQGRLRVLGRAWAVILAAAAHTAYKIALFAINPAQVRTDFLFLAVATLLGGIVFGALRERAGSVWPAVAAHACFDVLVYGDLAQAPWWVWQ